MQRYRYNIYSHIQDLLCRILLCIISIEILLRDDLTHWTGSKTVPPRNSSSISITRSARTRGLVCSGKTHSAEDRTFAPAFWTVAGNRRLGRAICWAASIHHSKNDYPSSLSISMWNMSENGSVLPQALHFSQGKWREKPVDFGAFPWLSAKARSRESLGNATEMGRKVARLSEKLGERFPCGDRWIGVGWRWLKIFLQKPPWRCRWQALLRSASGTYFFAPQRCHWSCGLFLTFESWDAQLDSLRVHGDMKDPEENP